MLISYKRGQGSIILRVKILNSSVTTGAGLTGLTFNSVGLIVSTIADNEATATAYTQAAGKIEDIAALGTYAAPTATKCRFKELDSTNHKGVYEIQIADARFAVASAKSLLVSISGASNCAETDALIPLVDLDPYDANPEVDLKQILGTTLTESGAGRIAAAVKKLFDVVTPVLVASDVMRGTDVVPPTVAQMNARTLLTAEYATIAICTEARLARLDATVSSRNAVTPPTVVQMNARTLLAAEYATLAGQAAIVEYINTEVAAILEDTNELQSDWKDGGRLDLILDTAAGGGDMAAILEDTNELQTDWKDGGRLDLLLDAVSGGATIELVTSGENLSSQ